MADILKFPVWAEQKKRFKNLKKYSFGDPEIVTEEDIINKYGSMNDYGILLIKSLINEGRIV
jgi:hypothetical protein